MRFDYGYGDFGRVTEEEGYVKEFKVREGIKMYWGLIMVTGVLVGCLRRRDMLRNSR